MLRASLTILGKDLRLRMRDRSVVLFAVIVPLGLTVLFSFILPSEGELSVTGAVVDEDGGAASIAFREQLLPQLTDLDLVRLDPSITSDEQAVAAVEDGRLDAVWRFPPGFSDALEAGQAAEIDVMVHGGRALSAEIARGIAESYASQLDRISLAVATTMAAAGGELDAAAIDAVIASASAAPSLASLTPLDAVDRQLDMTSYLAAGMAAFFVFFTVQWGITGLLEERQLGTLARLLAAPIRPVAIQVGKALGAFVLGVVAMTVLAVAADLLLGAEWGPWLGVAVLILAMVLAALGIMALVGSFARTAEQASNLQAIVAVVLGMLGGVFIPMPLGEGILAQLSRIAPHGWFLEGLGAQAGTGDWTDVLPSAAAILAFALVAAGLASIRLRKATRW